MVKMQTKQKWTKEKQSEYYKEWREKNKDKIKEYQKKWHLENKEHVADYVKNNSDHIKKTQKKYRETHKSELKILWDEWYKEHPERSARRRFSESKNKAIKKRGINWTLEFEDYNRLIQLDCYYCGNKLGEKVKRSCGLDRLDSNKGYELTNVVSCCNICNCIKNEHLTPEETKVAVEAILKYRKNYLIDKDLVKHS